MFYHFGLNFHLALFSGERSRQLNLEEEYAKLTETVDEARRLREVETVRRGAERQPGPQAAQPIPNVPQAVQPWRSPDFSSLLPLAKELALTACRSPNQVTVDINLAQPAYRISFSRESDDHAANNLSSGLGDCENRLFRRLIQVIRNGEGELINVKWVQDTAAAYGGATSGTPPTYSSPPQSEGNSVPPTQDHDPVRGRVRKIIPLK